MVRTEARPRVLAHPHVPGWQICLLSVATVAEGHPVDEPIDISRHQAPEVGQAVYRIVEDAPSRAVIGIDLRQIALMPSRLWRQVGPLLHSRALEGALGRDKRVLYLTGGDDETFNTFQWAFQDAAHEASSRAGRLTDRAGLVPAAPKGYCGVLRRPYEEVLDMVNQRGSLTNEQVVELVSHRYTLNNANNYLTALAELGLVYRQVAPRVSGGYAAHAHALTVPEEEMNYATSLV